MGQGIEREWRKEKTREKGGKRKGWRDTEGSLAYFIPVVL